MESSTGSFLKFSNCCKIITSLSIYGAQILFFSLQTILALYAKGKKIKHLIYRELYGKPLNCDWVARDVFPIQILLIFSGHCSHYFEIYTVDNLWVT